MSRRPAVTVIAAGLLAGVTLAGGPAGPAYAKEDTKRRTQVIARGLDNPRQLSVGPGQRIYVAEAGRGGDGPCGQGPEGERCFGASGAVTQIDRGRQKRVVTGLPSLAARDGSSASGPADAAVRGDTVTVLMGLGGTTADRAAFGPEAATLGTVLTGRLGTRLRVAGDPAAYEQTADPDGQGADTNPTGFVAKGAKDWAVVDAGGNSLVRVSKGGASTIATFPNRLVPGPGGAEMPMQSVPTDVAWGPDGALYVAELTGFPFPSGGAKIWRVVPGKAPTEYATGLTNVTSLEFKGGQLYAVQLADNGLPAGPTGSLRKVVRGSSTHPVVVGGLFAPYGLAIRGHDAYVTTGSVAPGAGEVVRISLK